MSEYDGGSSSNLPARKKIVISCPSCNKKLRFPAAYEGEVQCPNCKHVSRCEEGIRLTHLLQARLSPNRKKFPRITKMNLIKGFHVHRCFCIDEDGACPVGTSNMNQVSRRINVAELPTTMNTSRINVRKCPPCAWAFRQTKRCRASANFVQHSTSMRNSSTRSASAMRGSLRPLRSHRRV